MCVCMYVRQRYEGKEGQNQKRTIFENCNVHFSTCINNINMHSITYLSCLCIPDRNPGLNGVDAIDEGIFDDCMGVVTDGKVS